MNGKSNSKRIIKIIVTIIHVLFLSQMLFGMWMWHAMTPYQDWDISLKIIDGDKVGVIQAFYFLNTFINSILAFISRKRKVFCIIHILLAIFCVAYQGWLISVINA